MTREQILNMFRNENATIEEVNAFLAIMGDRESYTMKEAMWSLQVILKTRISGVGLC